ncbi:hypothetical protein HanIR_Chr02g0052071 [Helianthus annuus]|nr:hypothetical protein HanIR_Chr02g0052071 [Helianthus annuus]
MCGYLQRRSFRSFSLLVPTSSIIGRTCDSKIGYQPSLNLMLCMTILKIDFRKHSSGLTWPLLGCFLTRLRFNTTQNSIRAMSNI